MTSHYTRLLAPAVGYNDREVKDKQEVEAPQKSMGKMNGGSGGKAYIITYSPSTRDIAQLIAIV